MMEKLKFAAILRACNIRKVGILSSVTFLEIIIYIRHQIDQWSPHNPEGKKAYDRTFLLMLQKNPASQRKPEGLPNLEVVRDKVCLDEYVVYLNSVIYLMILNDGRT
jgi:hypothetical protein